MITSFVGMPILKFRYILLISLLMLSFSNACSKIKDDGWRSTLYPKDWTPGYSDESGRFLHDFSYAGYHAGERRIPNVQNNTVDVTKNPYNADNTGSEDVTEVLQRALNDVGRMGGGVVYLPSGTYKVSVDHDQNSALHIKYSNVVLRGAGKGKTKILNSTIHMRRKSIILVEGEDRMNWLEDKKNMTKIRIDLSKPTKQIPVESASGFNVGDRIVINSDVTDPFIQEHNMEGVWHNDLRGVTFYRKIVDIDYDDNIINIDSPTRYWLKTRDNAKVYKVNDPIEEVGIEDFSIGNVQHTQMVYEANDYQRDGTMGYDVHDSHAIEMFGCLNSWVRDIATFRPSDNQNDIHILSNGVLIEHSKNITIKNCDFQNSQYNGHGGNGYMFTLMGNNCLLKDNTAGNARHNFSFKTMMANGNVIYRCTGYASTHSSDFHMHLSMANLIDNFNVIGDYLETYNRKNIGTHGQTTTQSVFWNTNGVEYHENHSVIIRSQQFGHGYVIGTRGPASNVRVWSEFETGPIDFTEGIGKGSSLEPQSLYKDQLNRRLSGRGKAF